MIRWKNMTAERGRVASAAVVERAYAYFVAVIASVHRRFHANPEGPSTQEAVGQPEPVSVAPLDTTRDASDSDDTLPQIANHLAYLGYEISTGSDGWSYARHTG